MVLRRRCAALHVPQLFVLSGLLLCAIALSSLPFAHAQAQRRPLSRPLCENGVWTEVDPAAVRNGSSLPGVACGRDAGVCVEENYLTHLRCSTRPNDEDWPQLPQVSSHSLPEQAVVLQLFEQLRGKTAFFVGDSVNLNLWNFMLCELNRADLGAVKVSGFSKQECLTRAGELADAAARERVPGFWERWFAAPWDTEQPPVLGMEVEAFWVSRTETLIVRRSSHHFTRDEAGALTSLADVLVVNYGLHYDLVNDEQRSFYATHMRLLFGHLRAFAATPGKAAFYRETSRIHQRKLHGFPDIGAAYAKGHACACTATEDEAPRREGQMEWSDELNMLARRELASSGATVPVIPFYALTGAMHTGHLQNFSAYFNHLAAPTLCDCTHWRVPVCSSLNSRLTRSLPCRCYSPQLVRSVMLSMLQALPSTKLHATS